MERINWELHVYKADRRYNKGERKIKVYTYTNWTRTQMLDEVASLRKDLYRQQDGWRLEFNPSTVTVKNLMTGADVTIAADMKGTCCDPSQERFWTM